MSTKSINLNIELKSEEDIEKFLAAIEVSEECAESHCIEKVEDKIFLEECLDCLSKEELRVIKLRYGLDNDISKTQREVAYYLDVPQSYVSRLERVAFRKMRRLVDER